jgi:endonuclease YncB( thermonuclease family)
MPFQLIKGTFHVVGASPDGDSLRFRADDLGLIRGLAGSRPKIVGGDKVQLRLEAIDTLETHYAGRHQPDRWARAATERLLAFVGITSVQWDARHATVVAAADGTRGWILSREIEKNGRPVSFLFSGDPGQADGASVTLDVAQLRASYNHAALREGLAYPTYYQGLFSDLRAELTAVATQARAANQGLWPDDKTTAGFDAVNLGVIIDQRPILPKLFRRLSDFMAARGSAVGFRDAMAASQEPVLDLTTQNFTHFDTFIEQANGSVRIRLTRNPEELVFDAMPMRPVDHFEALLSSPDLPPA